MSERDLLRLGLSPEPMMPRIPVIEAPEAFSPAPGVPVETLNSDAVLTRWVFVNRIDQSGRRTSLRLAEALLGGVWEDEIRDLFARMRPLPASFVVPVSTPDFVPALDLRALANGEDAVGALFHAALRVDEPTRVRVCHGLTGEGVHAWCWVNGVSLPHGGFARLQPGVHSLVLETYSGRVWHGWQWPERRAAPRFTVVRDEELQAWHTWRHEFWEQAARQAQQPEASSTAGVEIDPDTLVGTPGFVRVGRSRNGAWWLVDADGRPFHYRAMCSVNVRGGTGGRRKGDPLASPEQVQHWARVIRDWGFNGLGSWTTPEFFESGLYCTEIIEAFYEGPYVQGGTYRYGIVPDVYDPRWEEAIDRKCRKLCSPLRENRMLVGYFLDNERSFLMTHRPKGVAGPTYRVGELPAEKRVIVAAEPIQNPEALGLLQLALSLPDDTPTAREAWRFVTERHGRDIAALGRAWGIELASRLDLNRMTNDGERLVHDAYLADEAEFVRLFVRRYFEICCGAIRRHDPHHLLIGLRWAGTPDPLVFEEERRWSDIISMNRYRVEIVEAFDAVYRATGKPILIGEFQPDNDSYRFVRNPIEPPGGYDTDDLRQFLRAVESTGRICEHPAIVGYTYYAWKNATRHPEEMRPVILCNHRATALRAAADRPAPAAPFAPLHGQVFVHLAHGGGAVMAFGLICRRGQWDTRVYGNCIHGNIDRCRVDGNRVRIELSYRSEPGMFALTPTEGTCSIDLTRVTETDLTGTYTYTGTSGDQQGTAFAYLHRPVPTPAL